MGILYTRLMLRSPECFAFFYLALIFLSNFVGIHVKMHVGNALAVSVFSKRIAHGMGAKCKMRSLTFNHSM